MRTVEIRMPSYQVLRDCQAWECSLGRVVQSGLNKRMDTPEEDPASFTSTQHILGPPNYPERAPEPSVPRCTYWIGLLMLS